VARIRSSGAAARSFQIAVRVPGLVVRGQRLIGQGRFSDAGPLFQQALAVLERRVGHWHPETATLYHHLGALELAAGNWLRGERFAREALRIRLRTRGPRHPEVAADMVALAALLDPQKKHQESEDLYRRAIDIYKRTYGARHVALAVAANTPAVVSAPPSARGAVTATINPRLASFRLHVGRSPVHRFGVFTDEVIPAGKRIIEYAGERIGRREGVKRWNPTQASYLFKLDSYWRIDGAVGGSGAEFVNHSCDPNTKAVLRRGTIQFVSKRRIARGEELTLDYKYSADLERVPCRCGARTCRGAINRPRQANT
jgi:tetratricopeptide (TPR) repeat protein